MPREVFVAGQVLTAAELNVVSDQSVMVFAGTAARGSAIPSPSEGMVTYTSDDDEVQVYDGSLWKAVGPGKILQVVSTTKTDTFTASLSGRTFSSNVTGLEASITPSSTSSKILITLHMSAVRTDNSDIMFKLLRDSTDIAIGDSAGSRQQLTGGFATVATGSIVTQNMGAQFLDSPASTSALTYGVQLFNPSSSTRTVAVNRTLGDTDDTGFGRHVSTITVMEVAG